MKEVTIVELTTRKEILYEGQEYYVYAQYKQPLYYGSEGVIPYSKNAEYQRDLITVPVHRFCKSFVKDKRSPWEIKHEEQFISYAPEVWKCLTLFKESLESEVSLYKLMHNNEVNKNKFLKECVESKEHTITCMQGYMDYYQKLQHGNLWNKLKWVFGIGSK